MVGYKNRVFDVGIKVRVYRKLPRGHFSVMANEGTHKGRVLIHSDHVLIKDVNFRVYEKSGRQSVLKTGHKNVHAYADGILLSISKQDITTSVDNEITYDPKRNPEIPSGKFYYRQLPEVDVESVDCLYLSEHKTYQVNQISQTTLFL
jgi:hypothetical protein